MATNIKRISFDLPPVPQSLIGFIETAVKDKRTMLSFIESPLAALRAAGVQIRGDKLTRTDCDRLIRVLGKLRDLVEVGKLAKDFRFEDVFTVSQLASYENTYTHSDSYCETHFKPDTSCEEKQDRGAGMYTKFDGSDGISRVIDESEIIAPLISPGDLAEITMKMSAKLNSIIEKVNA